MEVARFLLFSKFLEMIQDLTIIYISLIQHYV
jgi:hypothetical protein